MISCSSHFKVHRTLPFTYAECIVSTMMPSLNALLSPVCKLLVESLENLCVFLMFFNFFMVVVHNFEQ